MANFLSYDIELYNDIVGGSEIDFSTLIPSVGALTYSIGREDVSFYYNEPYMTTHKARELVMDMWTAYEKGVPVFGWNTLAFDFPLLASYSGEVEKCSRLALNSVDGMFLVVCHRGHMLGLDKALRGAGLDTKLHTVVLNDKTQLLEMSGAKAPELWRRGEYSAVKDYLAYDVIQPLKLAKWIEEQKGIRWINPTSGKISFISTTLLTVKEALRLPVPDTSWSKTPMKPRASFFDWIPEDILESETK